jgi:hypothetical protein
MGRGFEAHLNNSGLSVTHVSAMNLLVFNRGLSGATSPASDVESVGVNGVVRVSGSQGQDRPR